VISAPDERDLAAWNGPAADFCARLDDGVAGLKLAWSPRLGYVAKLDPQVEAATQRAARVFETLGATVGAADPGFADPVELIRTLWTAVAATVIDAVPAADRARIDPDLVRIAEHGRRYSLAGYLSAYQARAELAIAMARFLSTYDLLLTPQMPLV